MLMHKNTEVNVLKLCLCTLLKHLGEMKVQLHSLLTSSLDRGEWTLPLWKVHPVPTEREIG